MNLQDNLTFNFNNLIVSLSQLLLPLSTNTENQWQPFTDTGPQTITGRHSIYAALQWHANRPTILMHQHAQNALTYLQLYSPGTHETVPSQNAVQDLICQQLIHQEELI